MYFDPERGGTAAGSREHRALKFGYQSSDAREMGTWNVAQENLNEGRVLFRKRELDGMLATYHYMYVQS